MKKLLIIGILILFTVSIYSQDESSIDKYLDKGCNFDLNPRNESRTSIDFSKGNRIKGYKNGDFMMENSAFGSYKITEEEGINYFDILWDDNTSDKFLFIAGQGNLLMYNSNGFPFFTNMPLKDTKLEDMGPEEMRTRTEILSSSSHLIEGRIVYSTDNL